jgi:tRNA (uracil-5-)-methyltransferase
MASEFEAIIYISCNPHTLAENLLALRHSHRIEQLALFDQFPYTEHMECGVFLRRN